MSERTTDAAAARSQAPEVAEANADSPRRRHRWILAVAAGVAIVLVTVLIARSGGDAQVSGGGATTQVVEVTRGSMDETVSADGTVEAASTGDLSFTAAGTVAAVNVKAGDKVKTGQVLATLDAPELSSALAEAESSVAEAEASLEDNRSSGASDAQLAADEASLTAARDALTKAQQDAAGAALVAGFDGTVTSVGITVGERLASGGVGGTDATGSQSGSGQSAAGGDSSASPAGGGGLPTASGSADDASSSSSSTPQIQVVSTNRYSVELDVDSTSVDAITSGQEVTLTVTTGSSSGGFPGFPGGGGGGFPSFPGGGGQVPGGGNGNGGNGGGGAATTPGTGSSAATATGKVTEVGAVANADSGVARYPVTVTFTAGSDEFTVGATVSADIVTTARENVLQVPIRAVTTADGVSKVTVAIDGSAAGTTETRTVKTGLTANGMVEITKGLKAGEHVIVESPAVFGGGANTGNAPTNLPGGGSFPGANANGGTSR
jgi:macrolide-specific efflux system membrane fusion protein